jgi:hypothetical protein
MTKGPSTLGVSVSQTGDRRRKDSGGVNHHYKTCKEIMSEEIKQANLPLFNIKMMTTRMTSE